MSTNPDFARSEGVATGSTSGKGQGQGGGIDGGGHGVRGGRGSSPVQADAQGHLQPRLTLVARAVNLVRVGVDEAVPEVRLDRARELLGVPVEVDLEITFQPAG